MALIAMQNLVRIGSVVVVI